MTTICEQLIHKKASIAVIGLGYVGLPIALAFARKVRVIGYDISPERVEMMKRHEDPSQELDSEDFENCDIEFTTDAARLSEAAFYVVAVPTPIDQLSYPDLRPLLSASETIGRYLKKGDYVVYESTVYPGATEEDCVPVLEKVSGLKAYSDFMVGYSPERINPGDKVHTLSNTIKIVSGCNETALEAISQVYGLVIEAGLYKASSIKVAEAAKIVENTQRDINIALMNELAIIFGLQGINTYDVLEAAGTKWNFLHFTPGLVGGHCIGVDPYYLVHKARELKYNALLIGAGRFINDSMGTYIAQSLINGFIFNRKAVHEARVLIMGVTFKENVADIRNSKVVDIVAELRRFNVSIDITDPYASTEEMKQKYGFPLIEKPTGNYDAVIVAVAHREYKGLEEAYFKQITRQPAMLFDIKGLYRGKIKEMGYWSL